MVVSVLMVVVLVGVGAVASQAGKGGFVETPLLTPSFVSAEIKETG